MPSKRGIPPIDPRTLDGRDGQHSGNGKPPRKQREHAPPRAIDSPSHHAQRQEKKRRDRDQADALARQFPDTKAARRQKSRWIVNLPFVAFSLVAALLLAAAMFLLHTQRVKQQTALYRQQAAAAEAEGRWGDLADSVRDYLQLNPDDVEARVRLATATDRAATSPQGKCRAVVYYYHALGMVRDRVDLRQRLAMLLVELGGFPPAETEAHWLLDRDGRDPIGWRVLAACQYDRWRRDGRPVAITPAIIDVYNRALDVNPGDVQLSSRLAAIYWDEMRVSSEVLRRRLADDVMERMVQLNPDRADAYLARYQYGRDHRLPNKDKDLARALELAPDDVNVLLAAGLRSNEQEHFREARDYFRKVVRLASKDRRGHEGLGITFRGEGDLPSAIDAWREGLLYAGLDDIELNVKIADALLELRRWDEAEETITRLGHVARSLTATVSPTFRTRVRGMVARLEAKLALASGDLMKGIDQLQATRASQKVGAESEEDLTEQFQTMMRLGWTYGLLDQWDVAARQFEDAVTLMPRDAEARTALAAAWRSAGKPDLAIREYKHAVDLDPGNTALRVALAECELQQQFAAPTEQRNWEPFRNLMEQAKQQSPDAVRLQLLEAAFEGTMGRPQHAVELLEKAMAANPTSPRVAQTLVQAYQQLGNPRAADKTLADYEKARGRRAWLLRAELRLQRQEVPEAKQILREAAVSLEGLERLAVIRKLDQLGLEDDVRARLRQSLAAEAGRTSRPPLQLVQQLADFALETRDLADLARWEALLQRLEGEHGSLWRYYRAHRLLAETDSDQDKNLVEAAQLQAELEGLRPVWPAAYVIGGLVAQRRGRMEQAADAFQRAIALGEEHLSTYEHLITVLYRQNRFVDADHFLQRLDCDIANSQSLSAVALAVAAKRGQVDRTLALAMEGVKQRPDDPTALVWLGMAQQLSGKQDEAMVTFYRAVKLAPKDARTWTALAAFHAARKEQQPAREAIQNLAKNVGLEGGRREFVVAQGYELIHDRDQAELHYREAIRLSPGDVAIQAQAAAYFLPIDPGTAEACLRRVLAAAPGDVPARQKLAMMLVARGGEQSLQEAWTLLGGQASDDAGPPLMRRLQALLLLRRGDASSRRQAQALLEALVRDADDPSSDDRLILGTLYEDQGRLQAAREQLATLAHRRQPKASHLAGYVDFLLRHGSPVDADAPLKDLESLEPDNVRTLVLRARWLGRQKRAAEIEPLAEAFLRKQPAAMRGSPLWPEVLHRIADLYAELGLPAAAERTYRELARLTPEGLRPLALWLAGCGRRSEAIRLSMDAAAEGKSAEAAVALCDVLIGADAAQHDSAAVDATLAAALREHPKDDRLLFHVATLRCVQGRRAEAIGRYRAVLAQSPRHVAAMNNLAALLAEDPASTTEAEAQIRRAIEIGGVTAQLLDTEALVWMYEGKLSEAIRTLRELTGGAKPDPLHYLHLAMACQRSGVEAEAAAAWKRAESAGLDRQLLTPAERAARTKMQEAFRGKPPVQPPAAAKEGA